MKYFFFIPIKNPIFLSFLCILLSGCGTSRSHGSERTTSVNPHQLLDAVNHLRRKGCKCGSTYMPPAKPLKWNSRLQNAARTHSQYMNAHKKLSHTGAKNSQPGTRIKSAGYQWRFFAENIAAGQQTVQQVMTSWINSPGHCKNMMNKNAEDMGAAISGYYWTLVFAAPL